MSVFVTERLAGPNTHICWTPDNPDSPNRGVHVSLVRESDLRRVELERGEALDLLRALLASRPGAGRRAVLFLNRIG